MAAMIFIVLPNPERLRGDFMSNYAPGEADQQEWKTVFVFPMLRFFYAWYYS